MPSSKIKSFQSFKDIGICPDPLPSDVCLLRYVQSSKTGIPPYPQCFENWQGSNGSYNPTDTAHKNRDLTLSEFNTFDELIASKNNYVCRSANMNASGTYTLFASKYPISSTVEPSTTQNTDYGMNLMDAASLMAIEQGYFPFCLPGNRPYFRTMNGDLTPEAARYLTAKFPSAYDGCSESKTDGTIHYKIIVDVGSLDTAIAGIKKDIKNNTFPSGVTKSQAKDFISALEDVRAQDQSVMTKESFDKQEEMQEKFAKDNTRLTIWITVGSIGATVASMVLVFGGISAFQYWHQNKIRKEDLAVRKAEMEQIRQEHKESLEHSEKLARGEFGAKITLKNFTVDLVERAAKDLAPDNPMREINEIIGRDNEAIEYLYRLSRVEYANPFLIGKSGAGKDVIPKRAGQLIYLKDSRIPDIFLTGGKKLYYVKPVDYSATEGRVGSSATHFKLISDAMENGGHKFYFPELADAATSGAHSKGSAEALGKLLKAVGDQPWCGFSGSSTPRGYKTLMTMEGYEDLFRREPPMYVEEMLRETVSKIMHKNIGPWYAKHEKVEIPPEVVEASIKAGYDFYVKTGLAEVDSCKQALANGITRARKESGWKKIGLVVTVDDINKSAEKALQNAQNDYGEQNQFAQGPDSKLPSAKEILDSIQDIALTVEMNGEQIQHISTQLFKEPWFEAELPEIRAEIIAKVVRKINEADFRTQYVSSDGKLDPAGLAEILKSVGVEFTPGHSISIESPKVVESRTVDSIITDIRLTKVFAGLSKADARALAKDLHTQWTELSESDRAATSKISWMLDKSSALKKGQFAQGADAKVSEEKRKEKEKKEKERKAEEARKAGKPGKTQEPGKTPSPGSSKP